MAEKFESTPIPELLPEFFEKKKSFSAEEYKAEVQRLYPDFKEKWYQRTPSEKTIQNWIKEDHAYGVIEGADSVPKAEAELGIKIGTDYKFPEGKTGYEYNKEHFFKYGLSDTKTLGERATKDGKIDRKLAYMHAWSSLQYNQDEVLKSMQEDHKKLVELNPEFQNLKIDTNNKRSLITVRAGAAYSFPPADIEFFTQEHEKGVGLIGKVNRERIDKGLKEAGIEGYRLHWVPSDETIKMIGERLKEKNLSKGNEKQQTASHIKDIRGLGSAEAKPVVPQKIDGNNLSKLKQRDGD